MGEISISKKQISEVILTGSSTNIPSVQKIVRKFFPKVTFQDRVKPDEAVAKGAAILAAKLPDDARYTDDDDSKIQLHDS